MAIVGQEEVIDDLLIALFARGHTLHRRARLARPCW
jgi:hypothetical protein